MVFVQGGTFMMGQVGIFMAEPVHQVTLSSFNIGKYPVTQAQWEAVMGSNPSVYRGNNLPVETVSWYDIVGTAGTSVVINGITYYENGFINKLNQLTGKQYRLPTSAEWEYAARGGNASQGFQYSGSNNIDDVAWYSGNNTPNGTKPVGTKLPNELGIFDMNGNVVEICSDWFGNYTAEAKINPTGPATGSLRVVRGGCFTQSWEHVAFRGGNSHDIPASNVGFRLALSSE